MHATSGGRFGLMVAPTGARRSKLDHPALPISTEEIADTARLCAAEGATAIHLHVREADGAHSLDPGRYREAIAAIEERAPGLAIQVTTESADLFDVEAQYRAMAALRPRWASAAVREMARDVVVAARFYAMADETGMRVQHIMYGAECLAQLADWRATGVVRAGQNEAILVIGGYAPPVEARPSDLEAPLDAGAALDLSWMACAFGRQEVACLLRAIRRGCDARIGFENNIQAPDGAALPDNAASVRGFVEAARASGFTPATPTPWRSSSVRDDA